MNRGGFHWEKNGKHHRQMKKNSWNGYMFKRCREELEDKGQEIRDCKNNTGRKRLDRERRKKKSQMSRES